MTQEKLIRDQIKEKVLEETQRKVRCVFFIARTDHDTIIYGVGGNNKKLFCTSKFEHFCKKKHTCDDCADDMNVGDCTNCWKCKDGSEFRPFNGKKTWAKFS